MAECFSLTADTRTMLPFNVTRGTSIVSQTMLQGCVRKTALGVGKTGHVTVGFSSGDFHS